MLNKATFQRLDEAIDKVLNPSKVNEGYNELVQLLREGVYDDAIIYWQADANHQMYEHSKTIGTPDKSLLNKAINCYKRLMSDGHHDFLKQRVDSMQKEYDEI